MPLHVPASHVPDADLPFDAIVPENVCPPAPMLTAPHRSIPTTAAFVNPKLFSARLIEPVRCQVDPVLRENRNVAAHDPPRGAAEVPTRGAAQTPEEGGGWLSTVEPDHEPLDGVGHADALDAWAALRSLAAPAPPDPAKPATTATTTTPRAHTRADDFPRFLNPLTPP